MPRWATRTLSGWGRVCTATGPTARPERAAELADIARDTSQASLLACGAGRSYGDAGLNSSGATVMMGRLDRFTEFDPATGRLVAEAGVTFADVIRTFLPRGYLIPVTPGTGFATLGGGIANDVHGKNHHQAGSLGDHVDWLDLRLPDGELRRVTAKDDSPLYRATLGGIGLTGIIERVCLRLKAVPSNAVTVRKYRIRDLDHYLEMFTAEQDRSEYVVGWIDALATGRHLGRGILEAANPSAQGVEPTPPRTKSIPVDFPGFALNPMSVRLFNAAYYRRVAAAGMEQRMPYSGFLFPLDAVHDWNRIYGKRGFRQFQCVVPFESGRRALIEMLDLIGQSGLGSFLAVLKAMGRPGMGYLSFPRPGYTLALDFPESPGVRELIARLEAITCEHGGRTYLAKDSTLTPENLRRMYPDLDRYRAVLREIDPDARMQSDMGRRLGLRETSA